MKIVEVVQGSPEWHAVRCGEVTASRVADVMGKTKGGGYRTSRQNYMAELIAERLTGNPTPSFTTAAMIWGTEQEPNARLEYSFSRDLIIETTGFVRHPRIEHFGGSPDGLVTDRNELGLCEIKCPLTATHLETLRTGSVPTDYFLQIQANLACTGLQWCDYVSFDPRLPEPMQLFVRRLARDDETIERLEAEVALFLDDLGIAIDDLKRRFQVEEVV